MTMNPLAVAVVLVMLIACRSSPQGAKQTEPQPPLPASSKAVVEETRPAAAGSAATDRLPDVVLHAIVGCWQLEERERWTIQRTQQGGAEVTRAILDAGAGATNRDYVQRASLAANILFDATQKSYAFVTAGPIHSQLFVFTVADLTLDGSWAVSRAPGAKYVPQPGRVTLRRCEAADVGADRVEPTPRSIPFLKIPLPPSARSYYAHESGLRSTMLQLRVELAPADVKSFERHLPCTLGAEAGGEPEHGVVGTNDRSWYRAANVKKHRSCMYHRELRTAEFLLDLDDPQRVILYVVISND